MNDDLETLMVAVRNNPSDALLRMAYADCLESIGGDGNLAEADMQRKITKIIQQLIRKTP